MARSLISSITKPVSSLVSPLLKPAMRLAKHPLAPLGMGIAGAVAEKVSENVGLTQWLTTAGTESVNFLKSGAKLGMTTIAGIADFDGEDKPANETKVEKKTDVAGVVEKAISTPNAYEATTGIHVGCAADKPCGPCAKKKALARIAGAFEKMTEEEVEAFASKVNVGENRPKILIPRGKDDTSSYQSQILNLRTQLQQAKDAVTTQKLTDEIAALQDKLASALAPAPDYPAESPWGSYEETMTTIQDPNGMMYEDPSAGEFDGESLIDPANPMASFDTMGIEEDYDDVLDVSQEASVSGSVNEYMQPQPDEDPVNLDLGPREPETVLDDEIDCESCQRIY